MSNFINDDQISFSFSIRNNETGQVVAGTITRIAARQFTKSFVINELGADIEFGNLSNGQVGPYIKVPAGTYYASGAMLGWNQNISPIYMEVTNIDKLADVLLTDHRVSDLDSTKINADNLNTIVQYIGETTDGATQGYFYKASGTIITTDASAEITPVTENTTLSDPNFWIGAQAKNYTTDSEFTAAVQRVEGPEGDVYQIGIGPAPVGSGLWTWFDPAETATEGIVASLPPDIASAEFSYKYTAPTATITDPKWTQINVQPASVPPTPTTAGNYVLKATVAEGGTATLAWAAE